MVVQGQEGMTSRGFIARLMFEMFGPEVPKLSLVKVTEGRGDESVGVSSLEKMENAWKAEQLSLVFSRESMVTSHVELCKVKFG